MKTGDAVNNSNVKNLVIACLLRSEDVCDVLIREGIEPWNSELSAYWINENHDDLRAMPDNVFEAFLRGLVAPDTPH